MREGGREDMFRAQKDLACSNFPRFQLQPEASSACRGQPGTPLLLEDGIMEVKVVEKCSETELKVKVAPRPMFGPWSCSFSVHLRK